MKTSDLSRSDTEGLERPRDRSGSETLSSTVGKRPSDSDQREMFRTLRENMTDRIYFKDRKARFVCVSRAMAEIHGCSPEEMRGKTDHDLFVPELAALKFDDDLRVIRGRSIKNLIEIEAKPNGQTHWVSTTKMPWRDSHENIVGLVGISRDVTDQVETENSLRETTLRFSLALKSAQIVSWDWDLASGVIHVSAGLERQIGALEGPRFTIDDWKERLHPEDRAATIEELDRHLRGELPEFRREFRFLHSDGTYRWLLNTGQALAENGDKPTRMLGCQIDVTQRKTGELELQRAHATTEQLLAAVPSILISATWEGQIGHWNAAAERTFGICRDEAVRKPLKDCPVGWDWARVEDAIQSCHDRLETVSLDVLRFERDGASGFLELAINPVPDTFEGPADFLILALDITDHRLLQQELVQAQKLQSIGQLAAGIAHEINTPTQFIGDNLRFLQDATRSIAGLWEGTSTLRAKARTVPELQGELDEVEDRFEKTDFEFLLSEIPSSIEESLHGVGRIAKIVSAMKDFSHPGGEEMVPADLNKLVESTLTVSRSEWKYAAKVQLELEPDLPPVPCHASEFNQAFLNIIVNAAQAIRTSVEGTNDQGTITVSTASRGDMAEIRVTDTGTGIPKDVLPRIFDPFFTTKDVGEGTGQGLSITHSIVVDRHGGRLRCESEPGCGTTFIIELPFSPRASNSREGTEPAEEKTRRGTNSSRG